jgi:Ni/Co efflux regulator RcnB
MAAIISRNVLIAGCAAVAMAFAGIASADKPSWAGEKGGKGGGKEHGSQAKEHGPQAHVERFGDPHRAEVREYYEHEYKKGHCPPGLAKKNNGCMPPGQAKKWEVGHALPSTVRYYDVPAPLLVRLGPPAPGYRYVRVDDNILLLATGTRMVIDAITGLGR